MLNLLLTLLLTLGTPDIEPPPSIAANELPLSAVTDRPSETTPDATDRTDDPDLPGLLAERSIPFDEIGDLQPLFAEIENQRLILMGESTHGTSEFYRWRAKMSRYLIENRDVDFIAVEGDWPALFEINRYVKQKEGAASSVDKAMEAIDRWPHWMWRNEEFRELVEWLHDLNAERAPADRVGLYGVDLYAYETSMEQVIDYLENQNQELAEEAEEAYDCLTRYASIRSYLQQVARSNEHCGGEMERVLELIREFEDPWSRQDPAGFFHLEQNAKLAVNAERHLRANLQEGPQSWNVRARHFQQTADRLLEKYGIGSSGIVWAHNTHVGDARATQMASGGMVNIGQLSREIHGENGVYIIGQGAGEGRVLAARSWEGRREVMEIPEAQPQSWEGLLARTGQDRMLLLFSDMQLYHSLQDPIPHRAIGVTFQPEQEEQNNYVTTILPGRYDAFLYFRQTDILQTLDD